MHNHVILDHAITVLDYNVKIHLKYIVIDMEFTFPKAQWAKQLFKTEICVYLYSCICVPKSDVCLRRAMWISKQKLDQ